jgi:hypothetical protein
MKREECPQDRPKKRPYSAPTLVVRGTVLSLTKAKGGAFNDGSGKPRTKVAFTGQG